MAALPDGTRHVLPADASARHELIERLRRLYQGWGYQGIEVPALERYDLNHPRNDQSFKLSDRDSGVLALRSDFTPALAQLVRGHYPQAAAGRRALRLQYCGTVWHAIDPDVARTREFTQVGVELVGVSNARADAELIHLARESVREVGLVPRVEIGNPGFVRALFDLAEVPDEAREPLADAIDRKDLRTLESLVERLAVRPELREALLAVPDLYGQLGVLDEARRVAPWDATLRELDRLEAIVSEFEDASELLLDLGMARRLSYYTGVTFRAYTFDFGQPLLGGGRYDGALLPAAAGFTIGIERLAAALPAPTPAPAPPVVALDDAGARRLRAAGVAVLRSLSSDLETARDEALEQGAQYLLGERLERLATDATDATDAGSDESALRRLLEGDRGE